MTLRTGLFCDEGIAEHDIGDAGTIVTLVDELDAAEVGAGAGKASLASAACVHLGLEHDRSAESIEGREDFRRVAGHDAARNGGPGRRQQFLSLIFVNFHDEYSFVRK